jgi:hypothetical protein
MERKHHHEDTKRGHANGGTGAHEGGGHDGGRHDGGHGPAPGRRAGTGGVELAASGGDLDEDQDAAKEPDAAEDHDAADGEAGGAVAQAAAKGDSKGVIKSHTRNAWTAVRENEASIARGTYDTLKEPDDGKARSSGFFGTLFNGLIDVGVAQLLAKVSPTTAAGAALFAVYNAAKSEVTKRLPKPDNPNKVVASEFVEQYVRYLNAGWLTSADELDSRMEKLSKKSLLTLRKRMRELVRKTTIDNPKIKDALLTGWVAALNREHKQQDPSNDFVTETSGRLHLTGVHVMPPGKGQSSGEQIHGLTARVDGTGSIRQRFGLRTLGAVQVPVSVAGLTMPDRSVFSFGVGTDQQPKPGPMNVGATGGLKKYGGGDVTSGLAKLWGKMRGAKVNDLVGDNKPGGKTEGILAGD